MTKYLALDLGEATIGMAHSLTGMFATNCGTIRSKNHSKKELIEQLLSYLSTNNYDVLVIGNPKHMNGSEGVRSQFSYEVKEMVAKHFPSLKIILWDERLSTKSCYQVINILDKKQDFRKQMKDELAAEVILQTYLNSL